MKFDTTQFNFFNGCITIPIPKHLGSALQALIAAVSKGKVLQVQITIKRKQRSLDANAYLWALLGEMARVLYTDKDELYLQMLERYGVFTHIIVKPQAVEKVKASLEDPYDIIFMDVQMPVMNGHIAKPVEIQKLVEAVRQVLQ